MLTLEISLGGFLMVSELRNSLPLEELLNILVLDPLLPTLVLAALSLCVLLFLVYHSQPCLGATLDILTKPFAAGPTH